MQGFFPLLNTGLVLVSAIYGGDKRDKALQGAEGSPRPYRGIPCLKAGVTQRQSGAKKQSVSPMLAEERIQEMARAKRLDPQTGLPLKKGQ